MKEQINTIEKLFNQNTNITKVQVIGDDSEYINRNFFNAKISIQDDGKTLKVHINRINEVKSYDKCPSGEDIKNLYKNN